MSESGGSEQVYENNEDVTQGDPNNTAKSEETETISSGDGFPPTQYDLSIENEGVNEKEVDVNVDLQSSATEMDVEATHVETDEGMAEFSGDQVEMLNPGEITMEQATEEGGITMQQVEMTNNSEEIMQQQGSETEEQIVTPNQHHEMKSEFMQQEHEQMEDAEQSVLSESYIPENADPETSSVGQGTEISSTGTIGQLTTVPQHTMSSKQPIALSSQQVVLGQTVVVNSRTGLQGLQPSVVRSQLIGQGQHPVAVGAQQTITLGTRQIVLPQSFTTTSGEPITMNSRHILVDGKHFIIQPHQLAMPTTIAQVKQGETQPQKLPAGQVLQQSNSASAQIHQADSMAGGDTTGVIDEVPGEEFEGGEDEYEEYDAIKPAALSKKKRHVCLRCGQHFDMWIRLAEHRSKHGRERRLGFQCKKCGEHFRLKVSLAEHSCSRMRRKKCCPCPKCGILFYKKDVLLWHMWHHPKEKKDIYPKIKVENGGEGVITPVEKFKICECGECGARFKKRTVLTKHMIIHTGKRPFICEECGSAFTQQGHIRRHLAVHKGEVLHVCPECGAKFRNTDTLLKHVKKHEDGISVMCEECGQMFDKPSDLREHKKEHTAPKFSCGICGYDYTYFASYKKHLQQHEATEYQCPECGVNVSIDTEFEDHCETHVEDVERSYICELCGATFGQSFKLKQHLTMHELKTGYECIHCQATYKYFSSFRKHMLLHGAQQYLCPVCGELVNLEDETASHLCRGEMESGGNSGGTLSAQDEVEMITARHELDQSTVEGGNTTTTYITETSVGGNTILHEVDGSEMEDGVVRDLSEATIVEAMQDPTTGALIAADGTVLQNITNATFMGEGLQGATAMVDENNTVVLVISDGSFNMEDLAHVTE